MEPSQQEFVEFALDAGAISFGDFVTKSGRRTPFFINTGAFRTGSQLRRLGGFYADAIHSAFGRDVDVLFGPAYKAIPLAVAASVALVERHGVDVAFASLRKELKDHGDVGAWLGRSPAAGDRVVIIEDVTTAGTSIRESMPALVAAGAEVLGLVVAVDRRERGTGAASALDEIGATFGFATTAIVTMGEVVEHLASLGRLDDDLRARVDAYYTEFGPSA